MSLKPDLDILAQGASRPAFFIPYWTFTFHCQSSGQSSPGSVRCYILALCSPLILFCRCCNRLTGHTCVICQEPIRGFEIRAPCGDYYDKDCACDLFEASTRDESLFPPRCCRQPIPLRLIQSHLSPNLVTLFNEKTIELGTLKRVYCANPTCSRFLGPQDQGLGWFSGPKLYNCTSVKCKTTTCGRCKVAVDPSSYHVCKEDTKDREVLAMGQTEGWARCPGCEQMIELNMGYFLSLLIACYCALIHNISLSDVII